MTILTGATMTCEMVETRLMTMVTVKGQAVVGG